jgi:hypothetical protein
MLLENKDRSNSVVVDVPIFKKRSYKNWYEIYVEFIFNTY